MSNGLTGLGTARWRPLATAGIGVVLVGAGTCYLTFPLGYNQAIYHYMGSVLRNGGVPYENFLDIKGPLGLWFYGLPGVLLGSSDKVYRLFDLCVMAAIGIGLYRLLRLSCSSFLALAGAFLWFIHVLLDGPGNTGDVTNLIALGVVTILFLLQRPGTKPFAAIGMVVAAVAWVKPTAILIVLPVILFYLLQDSRQGQRIWKDGARLLAGATLMSLLMIGLLVGTGSFKSFYETVIIDALRTYLPRTQFVMRHNIQGIAKWLLHDPVFRIGGLLALFVAGRQARIYQVAVLGGLASVVVQSRFFPYHFSPILPLLAVGLILGWSKIATLQPRNKFGILSTVAVSLGCVLLLFQPLNLLATDLSTIHKARSRTDLAGLFLLSDLRNLYRSRLLVAKELRPLINNRDNLTVVGGDVGIYLELNKLAPNRHGNPAAVLYDYHKKVQNSVRAKWRDEILASLAKGRSSWLIIDKNLWRHLDPGAKSALENDLHGRYKWRFNLGIYRVYRRIPPPASGDLSLSPGKEKNR